MPTLVPRKTYFHSSVPVETWHASSLRPSLGLFFGKFYFIDLVSDFWNTGLDDMTVNIDHRPLDFDHQHWPRLWPSTFTIDIYHHRRWPSILTIDFDHRLWPSKLTIDIDHEHWPSALTVNIDHWHWPSSLTIEFDYHLWPSTLTMDIDHEHWSSALTIDFDHQHWPRLWP